MDEALLDGLRRGDRRSLARLLTLAARGEAEQFLTQLPPVAKQSRVVAITGSGGVGKSTLVGKLMEHIREQGQTVAVLACDPESPLSGGALLGDRFRMPSRPDDRGVFIRSLAAASGQGAVARHLPAMVRLLEAFGFDVVVIETAGAGQGDTAVRDLADVVVLLLQPETGDDLQWEKAGVLEVADIVVVHKADLPGADRVESQVRAILGLTGAATVPVLRVSARTGEGIGALWTAIEACPVRRPVGSESGRALLRLAQEALAERFAVAEAAQVPALRELLAEWQQGKLEQSAAVSALLRLLSDGEVPHGARL
jgi:LAO/AO transport system ATPase